MAFKVERWQARDGQLFPTQQEADEYETRKELELEITGLVHDNLSCGEFDDHGFVRDLMTRFHLTQKK